MSDSRAAVAKLSRVDKAAVLLLSLGETDAAQVLRHMGPKEVQRVGVAMAQMRNVHREQVEQVMSEFVEIVGDQTSLGVGSDSYIRKMLTSALGEDKANGLIDRILLGGNTSGLDSLKWMEPRAVADVIRYEHPQIQAIVVAYLDPDQAGEVLGHFDHKVRLGIIPSPAQRLYPLLRVIEKSVEQLRILALHDLLQASQHIGVQMNLCHLFAP